MSLSKSEATITEGSTPTYVAVLEKAVFLGTQVTHKPLPLAEISAITLTYTNDADSSVINSRNAQDVKNANNVTITERGELFWYIQTGDAKIVSASLSSGDLEPHTAVFKITTTGSKVYYKTLNLWVKKR